MVKFFNFHKKMEGMPCDETKEEKTQKKVKKGRKMRDVTVL